MIDISTSPVKWRKTIVAARATIGSAVAAVECVSTGTTVTKLWVQHVSLETKGASHRLV